MGDTKLIRIKLDTQGNKTTCILDNNNVKTEYTVEEVISMLKNGVYIKNVALDSEDLKAVPSMRRFEDLTDKLINQWHVIEYLGDYYWRCQCSCGKIRAVFCARLKNGTSASCGHDTNKFKDLTGQTFGHWTALKYISNKMWLCRCELCQTVKGVNKDSLLDGKSHSCGCTTTGFKDLKGQTFGKLTTKRFLGNGLWECECTCKKIRLIHRQSLLTGQSTSCGACNRTDWQVEALSSAEKFNSVLLNACRTISSSLTLQEVAEIFNISVSNASRLVIQYNSEMYIRYITEFGTSSAELEILDYVKQLTNNVVNNTRRVLKDKELDIYIPDYNFAIEYNGIYWHSADRKEKTYHISKTQECNRLNIRLLHIFEYEWLDNRKQTILKNIIRSHLGMNTHVYARQTTIKSVSTSEAKQFLDENHLQGYVPATEQYGLYFKNQLVELMTFGAPRYTVDCSYELLRLCTKSGYSIIGGANKLFKHFLKRHNDVSIVSYCDISKFTGNVYSKLGMQLDNITTPNYVYVSLDTFETLSRHQCTKQKLLERNLGTEEQTEEEIMRNHNYVKIYDCGNARYIFRK